MKHPLKEIYNWNNASYYCVTWRLKICSNTYTQHNRACKQIFGQARSGLDRLDQRFSTWGTRTPGGTPSTQRGYASSWLADCIKFRSSQCMLVLVFKLMIIKNAFFILISFTGGAICVLRVTILMWGVRKWVQSWCGGTQRGTSLIWGYTKGYSFDLGVRKYQKFENRWARFKIIYSEIRLIGSRLIG